MRNPLVPLVVLSVLFAASAAATHVQRYDFSWQTTGDSVYAQGYSQEGTAHAVNATIVGNLTLVHVRLLWTDDVGAPDEFTLSVDGPAGHGEASGAGGDVAVEYPLGATPQETWTVEAESEPAARAQSDVEHPGASHGSGEWIVTVHLRDAGDGGSLFGRETDSGNDWRLEITWAGYESAVQSATPIEHEAPAPDPTPDPSPDPLAEAPASPPPAARAPAWGGLSVGLVAFGGIGVGLWALVARWRRQGRLD